VPAEGPADRELAELVADHVLGDEDVEEGAAVVDLEGVADELRDDRAAPGPGLDRLLAARGVHPLDLTVELLFDVRAFFQTASHRSPAVGSWLLAFGCWLLAEPVLTVACCLLPAAFLFRTPARTACSCGAG